MAYGARARGSRSFRRSLRTGKPSPRGVEPHGAGKQASLQGGGTGRCDTSSLDLPQSGNWRAGYFESCLSGSGGAGRKGSNDLARGLPYLVPRSRFRQRVSAQRSAANTS